MWFEAMYKADLPTNRSIFIFLIYGRAFRDTFSGLVLSCFIHSTLCGNIVYIT